MSKIQHICVLVILCLSPLLSLSQEKNHILWVHEEDGKQYVTYATVRFLNMSGKIIAAYSTGEEGYVSIPDSISNRNDINISISSLGYSTIDTKFDAHQLTYYLIRTSETLEEVVIQAKGDYLKVEATKLIYKVSDDLENNNGTISNAMRVLPAINVDLLGNISMQNKKILYLLNGVEDPLVRNGTSLKSVSAKHIESIELITHADPKYLERGFDIVINIITKYELVYGVLGDLTLLGNSREVLNGNGSLFYRNNNNSVKLTTATNNSFVNTRHKTTSYTDNFHNTLEGENDNRDIRVNSSLQISRYLKNKTLISGYFDYGYHRNSNLTENELIKANSTYLSEVNTSYKDHTFVFGASSSFPKIGKNTSGYLAASFSFKPEKNNSTIIEDIMTESTFNQVDQQSRILVVQGDFSSKISSKISMDYGVQKIFRKFDVQRIKTDGNLPFEHGQTEVIQDINSLMLFLKYNLDKRTRIDVGTRIDYSQISSQETSVLLFEQNAIVPLPRITLSRSLAQNRVLSLSYRRNVRRPSLMFLTTFNDFSNNLLVNTGNSELRPEISDIFSISHSFYFKGFYFRPELYSSYSGNYIQQVSYVENDITYFGYNNAASSWLNSVYLSFGGRVTKWINFNLSGGIGKMAVESADGESFDNIFYTLNVSNTYKIGTKGYSAQLNGFFNSPTIFAQGRSSATNMYSIGLSKSILDNKGSVGLNFSDPFLKRRLYETDIVNTLNNKSYRQARLISLSFFYRFGSLNQSKSVFIRKTSVDDVKTQL